TSRLLLPRDRRDRRRGAEELLRCDTPAGRRRGCGVRDSRRKKSRRTCAGGRGGVCIGAR
ncbi:MAG: hypothetical protein ACK5QX_08165, partial [bacterium]